MLAAWESDTQRLCAPETTAAATHFFCAAHAIGRFILFVHDKVYTIAHNVYHVDYLTSRLHGTFGRRRRRRCAYASCQQTKNRTKRFTSFLICPKHIVRR